MHSQKTLSFFTQRSMPSIDERRVEPFTWLEFISDNDSVHNFWLYHYGNKELGEEIDEHDNKDECPEKSHLLNYIGSFDPKLYRGNVDLRSKLYFKYSRSNSEELKELRTVSNTLKCTILAAQGRQYIYPHKNLTREEMEWQTKTVEHCETANKFFSDYIDKEEKMMAERLEAEGGLVPYFNDEERRKWHRVDDCGGWIHDDGRTWEETEHNGMLPYDEEGDTEEDEPETVNVTDLSEEEARRSAEAYAALHGL